MTDRLAVLAPIAVILIGGIFLWLDRRSGR